MDDLIDKVSFHLNCLRAQRDANDFVSFVDVAKDLKEHVIEWLDTEEDSQ